MIRKLKDIPQNWPQAPTDWLRLREFLQQIKDYLEALVKDPSPPEQVSALEAITLSGGIQLRWKTTLRTTYYKIFRAIKSNDFANAVEIAWIGDAFLPKYFDPAGQEPGARTYWVQAFNPFNEGLRSTSVTVAEPAFNGGGGGGGGGGSGSDELEPHATTHENGGTDEIDVTGLSGLLADPQTPLGHHTSHENGGADEISVTGLSGLLADGQTPLGHHTSHESGGTDAIKLDDLATPDDNTDLNSTTGHHGLLKKLSGTSTEFMNGAGNWATPATGTGDVVGPVAATNGAVAIFDGVTGKLLKDISLFGANVVTNAAAVTGDHLVSFDGNGGRLIKDSGIVGSNLVTGPSGSTADHVVTFNGTTGKIIKDSGLTLAGSNSGDVTLAGTPDYITIAAQVVTRALINLASHVTGRLPFANFIAATAASVLVGRRSGSTGDMEEVTLGNGLSMSSGAVLSSKDFYSFTINILGTPSVANDVSLNRFELPCDMTVSAVRSTALTGPSISYFAADILYKRGAGSWTSIFNSGDSNKAYIAAGDTSGNQTSLAVTALLTGDLIRMDILAVNGASGLTIIVKGTTP